MKQLPFIHQRKIEFIRNYSFPPLFLSILQLGIQSKCECHLHCALSLFCLVSFVPFAPYNTKPVRTCIFVVYALALALVPSLLLSLSFFLSVSFCFCISPFCSLTPPHHHTPTLLLTPPPLSPLRSLRPPCVLPPLLQSQMQERGGRAS